MAKLLREMLKLDGAIYAQDIAADAFVISAFFPLARERKALVHVLTQFAAGLEVGDTIDIGFIDDSIGGAVPIASGGLAALVAAPANPAVHDFHQMVAGINATLIGIDIPAVPAGASITINGVVFPYNAAPAQPPPEWNDAGELAAAINALCPGLIAVAPGVAFDVDIQSAVPGEQTITVENIVTFAADEVLILQQQSVIEVDASELVPGATTVAVVVDNLVGNADAATSAASLVRGNGRYEPVPQAVT